MTTDWTHLGREGYARLPHRGADALWPDPPEIRYAIRDLPREQRTPETVATMARDYLAGWKAAHEEAEAAKAPAVEEPKGKLTIAHTSADGTLLEGSRKGDGAWEAIKAAQSTYQIRGWRYMPSIRTIAVSHSRDRAPHLLLISRTAEVLREAGFVVEVVVDGAPRAMVESEADRAERMDDRADALTAKAERKSSEADRRWQAAQEIAEYIPAGQPILRGHHSERGHRRDLRRMDNHQRKSLELEKGAERAAGAAASAQRHMDLREAPNRVHNRIKTLKADRRKAQRSLDGHTRNHLRHDGSTYHRSVTPPATGLHREELELRAAHLDVQIPYWEGILAEHEAAGRWKTPDSTGIAKGDHVQCGRNGKWYPVLRVNKQTLSVNPGWEGGRIRVALESVTAVRKAGDAAVMTLDETAQGCSSKVLNSGVAEDRSRLLCWQVGRSPALGGAGVGLHISNALEDAVGYRQSPLRKDSS